MPKVKAAYTGLYTCLKGYAKACRYPMATGIYRTVSPTLADSLELLDHHRKVARSSLLCMYYFGKCSSKLAELVPLPYSHESPLSRRKDIWNYIKTYAF